MKHATRALLGPIALLTMLGCTKTPEIDSRPPVAPLRASLASDASFDVATHTTATMEGVVKLLDELDEATPPGDKLRGLKIRLGVLQAYLALIASHLSPEEQAEVRALAKELFKLGQELRENPKRGT